MHRRLGGEGWTPTHEEAARPYTIEVTVMPESKTGSQIPATFDRFISTDWFRRALSQSERATPVGTGVLPAVVIRGDWCIVDIRKRGRSGRSTSRTEKRIADLRGRAAIAQAKGEDA